MPAYAQGSEHKELINQHLVQLATASNASALRYIFYTQHQQGSPRSLSRRPVQELAFALSMPEL